jgi:HEAT repeat protein
MKTCTLAALFLLGTALASAQVREGLLKKEDIPRTIEQLKSSIPKVRANAAELLGQRGAVRSSDVKEAVGPLLHLLREDKNADVRKAAAEALGKIGRDPKEAVPALVEAMKTDRAAPVKVAAINALGQFGPDARAAVPDLRELAREKGKEKRQFTRAARQALKSINGK